MLENFNDDAETGKISDLNEGAKVITQMQNKHNLPERSHICCKNDRHKAIYEYCINKQNLLQLVFEALQEVVVKKD